MHAPSSIQLQRYATGGAHPSHSRRKTSLPRAHFSVMSRAAILHVMYLRVHIIARWLIACDNSLAPRVCLSTVRTQTGRKFAINNTPPGLSLRMKYRMYALGNSYEVIEREQSQPS